MSKFICRLFGHNWSVNYGRDGKLKSSVCLRCNVYEYPKVVKDKVKLSPKDYWELACHMSEIYVTEEKDGFRGMVEPTNGVEFFMDTETPSIGLESVLDKYIRNAGPINVGMDVEVGK